jgi:glycosyltransferase involved in cell wall biosynthesis
MKECLTVVIPCYNEEKTIFDLLQRVLKQDTVREIIIINDASTDSSIQEIKKATDARITLLSNSTNLGKGASVRKGFDLASSEFVLIQDADLEYSPEEYPRLLKPLLEGYADAVFGSRFLSFESRRALYFWHSMGNRALTLLSNALTNIYLTDMETCYKAMRVEFARNLSIQENRFGIEPEITAKLARMDARIYEVPISYRGRTYDEGKKITWRDGISAIRCLLKYNLGPARFKSNEGPRTLGRA